MLYLSKNSCLRIFVNPGPGKQWSFLLFCWQSNYLCAFQIGIRGFVTQLGEISPNLVKHGWHILYFVFLCVFYQLSGMEK